MTPGYVLVTGGAGFIGCSLADRLASDGERVLVFDSLARSGVAANVAWLCSRHGVLVSSVVADVRDADAVSRAVAGAKAVFHLAAQTAVTTSIDDPLVDFNVNLLGTINVLEALRRNPVPLLFASTNKVYGELVGMSVERGTEAYHPRDAAVATTGISEQQALQFCTPYGCSKGAADQYVLDYAATFGLKLAVLRMSCIYGPRQLGTEDQGWVAHFALKALSGEPVTVYGDGYQVRDILYVDDAVTAYLAAWQQIDRIAGQAFNLGGGSANAVSVLAVLRHIRAELRRPWQIRFAPWRPHDQRWFVADTRRARAALGLAAPLPWREGLARLLRSLAARQREAVST